HSIGNEATTFRPDPARSALECAGRVSIYRDDDGALDPFSARCAVAVPINRDSARALQKLAPIPPTLRVQGRGRKVTQMFYQSSPKRGILGSRLFLTIALLGCLALIMLTLFRQPRVVAIPEVFPATTSNNPETTQRKLEGDEARVYLEQT